MSTFMANKGNIVRKWQHELCFRKSYFLFFS